MKVFFGGIVHASAVGVLWCASAAAVAQNVAAVDESLVRGIYARLDAITAEIDRLRAAVQAQERRLDVTDRQLLQRYVEIDTRLRALSGDLPASEAPDVVAAGQGFDVALQAAIAHLQGGEFAQAHAMLSTALLENPADKDAATAWFWLGEASLQLDLLADAEQAFGYIIAAFPEHWRVPTSHYKLGEIFARRGEYNQARTKYRAVLRDYAQSPAARVARLALEALELAQ